MGVSRASQIVDANFKIKGLDALNKELKKLPDDMRTKALNGALLASTKILKDRAIAYVPVDTGNLRGAIKAGRAPKKQQVSKWNPKYKVSIKKKGKVTILSRGKKRRSNSTFYARIVEEGSSKMQPRPFMRQAFISTRGQAVRVFAKILDKKIAFFNKKLQRLRS